MNRTPRGASAHPRVIHILLFAIAFALPAPARAGQARPAAVDVSGRIADSGGGALAGAIVTTVIADREDETSTSGEDGRYRLSVPSGVPFEIRVHLDGFADRAIELPGTTEALVRNVTLQIGRLSDTLVVTASRGVEARADVTASTSVMTAGDIAAVGAASLADVMKQIPGVAVESTGREGALTSLFSRGGESDYNLVLIDGVRVNQNGGGYDFSRVSAAEIERVEVVRGAQSSLWGSDAMGAVVQIFTRRSTAPGAAWTSGSIEGGSFDTWRGDARVSGAAAGRLDYSLGGTYRRTNGAFSDILPEPDRFEQGTADATIGASLGERASARSTLRYSNAQGRNVGNIDYGTRDRGTAYDSTDVTWHADLSHTAGSRFAATASIDTFRSRSVSADTIADPSFNVYAILQGTPGARFPDSPRLVRLIGAQEFASPGALAPGQFVAFTPFGINDFVSSSRTRFRRTAVRYQGDYLWAAGQRLTGGYEFERETNPLVASFTNTNNAVFVQQQWAFGQRWFASLGGRLDDKSFYGQFFSPKVSAGGFPLPVRPGAVSSVKVFANLGKGIKIPTFGERFGSSFADGNPELKPERARSADLGVDATFVDQRVRALVAYFDNDFRDQVEFLSSDPGFRLDGRADFINIAGSEAHGWEMEAALQRPFAGVTAAATYAFVHSEVLATVQSGAQFQPGQPLLRRPEHSGTVRVGYGRGPLVVSFDARFVGQRHDSSFLSLRAVPANVSTDITVNPGYTIAGLGIDLKVHRSLVVFARADNLADTKYESALGYPGLPRAAFVGLRVSAGMNR